jgi:hypothetical protein
MKYIFFLVLSATAVSCNTQEAPKPKQSLETYVRFLKQEGQIHTEAVMRTAENGKAPLPMEVAGGIRYQNQDMNIQPHRGITYYYDKTGGFEATHTFSWKDDKGREQKFQTQLDPITDFRFSSPSIDRKQPTTFSWTGRPLGKGETLVFMWENPEKRLTVPLEVINPGPASSMVYPAAKLSELEPGLWTLYLVRKKLLKADVNGVDCTGIMEYFTHTDTFTVR